MSAIVGLNWLFLILGAVPALIAFPRTAWTAVLFSGLYVIGFQLLPRSLLRRPVWREGAVIVASALTASSMSLAGGFDSAFLLLAITPIILAALMGGYRLGFATAGLSAGILVVIETSRVTIDYGAVVSWVGLVTLVAGTFGLARRLLLEAMERVEALTEMTAVTGARLEQLENTNSLLNRLVALTDSDELSANNIGEATLSTVRSAVPFEAAEIYMINDGTPLLMAATGVPTGVSEAIVIETGSRRLGELRLFLDRPLTDRQRSVIDELLTPTAISFANIMLVERIAANAIRDERLRVARELHDGIGPGLAALGLAMDLAAMGSRGAIEEQLIALRASVTDLVTDVRSAVEDLREVSETSTLAAITQLVDDTDQAVNVELVEHAPIPGQRGENITAIAIEAIRNAVTHATDSRITVTGVIEGNRGRIRVKDDGPGFDPAAVPDGRFGLVGMHERAAAADATISIHSVSGSGTSIDIEWVPQ